MPARTGEQFVKSLQRNNMRLYLDGRQMEDVTQQPAFQGPLTALAQLYDLQHDPRYREFMLYPSPSKWRFRRPLISDPLLAPGHLFVMGWCLNQDNFARRGAQFGENAVRYYEYVRENDLFLTHVLGTPQTDRSNPA
jgi:aromatic ring hydroxylase